MIQKNLKNYKNLMGKFIYVVINKIYYKMNIKLVEQQVALNNH